MYACMNIQTHTQAAEPLCPWYPLTRKCIQQVQTLAQELMSGLKRHKLKFGLSVCNVQKTVVFHGWPISVCANLSPSLRVSKLGPEANEQNHNPWLWTLSWAALGLGGTSLCIWVTDLLKHFTNSPLDEMTIFQASWQLKVFYFSKSNLCPENFNM